MTKIHHKKNLAMIQKGAIGENGSFPSSFQYCKYDKMVQHLVSGRSVG
jgi:hypothetical protein